MNTIWNFEGHCFDKLTELEEINFNYVDAIGNITEGFVRNHKKLRSLNLAHNRIQGALPDIDQWKDMNEMRFIELNNNNFSGPLPAIWTESFPYLEFLNIQFNNFGDDEQGIPILSASQKVIALDFSNNKFRGDFPEQYFSAQEFQLLEFVSAKFNTFVPPSYIPDLCAEQYYCNKKRRGEARDANVQLYLE